MADDPDRFDPYRTLKEYARHLDGIRWRFGLPFYDALSGGLVWTDETRDMVRRTPTDVIWALRFLWAYRTSLMLNQPRAELAEYWQFGLAHFPRWVGLRPGHGNRPRDCWRSITRAKRVSGSADPEPRLPNPAHVTDCSKRPRPPHAPFTWSDARAATTRGFSNRG